MPPFFQPSINLSIPSISFHGAVSSVYNPSPKDGFVSNPIYENFSDRARIELEAKANSKIRELLGKYNLPIKVNTEELIKLQQGHLKDTRLVAAKIYSNLPANLKKEVNLQQLQEAAMLHDYGKILIPNNILNKQGALSQAEKEIMNLHSELGYELLKNKGLDDNTLRLIRYHHQNSAKNGYPAVTENYEHSLAAQILNAADQYTALREARCYKRALSKEEALDILGQDTNISPEIYNALARAA